VARPPITLYRAPFSTNVERVALALAHKGLAVESVVIDYSDRSPVERVSGQGLVPAIDDAGEVVADSRRILRYLEERHPDPPLFPSDPARRAEVDVFLDWFDEVWKVAPNAIEAELGAPEPDRERIEARSALMAGWLDRFEQLLDGRDHLMGDELGAADCIAFPFLKYAGSRDPADDELFHRLLEEHQRPGDDHPRLLAWIDRVDARPRAY
jgi:glutathione S-transferase